MIYLFYALLVLLCVALFVFIIIKIRNTKGIKQIIPIWILMLFACLIGIIFVTYGSLLDVNFIPTPNWQEEFRRLVVSILYNLGQALFVAGVVGVIFEMKSIKSYFEKSISDILIGDDYLSFQEDIELMRLRQRATKNIYLKKSKQVDDDLIKLDEAICAALTDPYYNNLSENCSIKFSDDGKYLIKTIKTRFQLVNPRDTQVNLFDFWNPKVRFKSIEGIKDDEIRQLIGFDVWVDGKEVFSIIDNVKIANFPDKMHELDEEYTIKTEMALKNKDSQSLLTFSDTLKAYIFEQRFIPLNDLTVSMRLVTMAKTFKYGLVFEGAKVDMLGNIYGTMSNPRDGLIIDKDSNSIALESTKWMLRGNGVYINIVPKNWSITK